MKRAIIAAALFLSAFPGFAENKLPPIKAVLLPFREAVIAARIDGTLESYKFQPGERFKEKAVLAELDNKRFAIELKRSTEQFEFAKTVYEDQKRLHEKNFTSDFELKKREFELKAAENNLMESKLNYSYCTINAPFPGKIEEILTREHETVRTGQPLFRIIDDNSLLALLNIPISGQSRFKLGTKVTITLPENNLSATGKVYEIMPRADHRSGTIQVKILIDNRDGRYTAGMTGELVNDK